MKNFLILSIVLGSIVWSCKKHSLTYANCCDNPPFEATIGRQKISIANVFTPNFDGDLTNHCPSQNTNCAFPIQYDASQSQFNKTLPTDENCK
jgi:hypothetical protein